MKGEGGREGWENKREFTKYPPEIDTALLHVSLWDKIDTEVLIKAFLSKGILSRYLIRNLDVDSTSMCCCFLMNNFSL